MIQDLTSLDFHNPWNLPPTHPCEDIRFNTYGVGLWVVLAPLACVNGQRLVGLIEGFIPGYAEWRWL